jgi:DNA-binding response OmpR family regulator
MKSIFAATHFQPPQFRLSISFARERSLTISLTFSNLDGKLTFPFYIDIVIREFELMHILVAEDDLPVAYFLSSGLEAEHFDVRVANTGKAVLPMLEEGPCDLLILDLYLPDMSGLEVMSQVRSNRPHIPILILTGNTRVEDRVGGLNSGADDYLTKPFAFSELLARIRALLRRGSHSYEPVLRSEDLELDRVKRVVRRNGNPIELTPKEFALLEYLMLNAGQSVSRSSIIHNVWKLSSDTMTNVVDVYINYLRKKIDADTPDRLIHTVRGAGYRIGPKPDSAH